MLILTFWEDPKIKNDPDDFDSILEIRLKSVKQIPELMAHMPAKCTMVSTEYSGNHLRRGKISTPDNPRRFKEIWRKGQPIPEAKSNKCPLCGQSTL
jgi:hypothetical protein